MQTARWIELSPSTSRALRSKRSLSSQPGDIVGIGNDEDLVVSDSAQTREGTNVTRYRETYRGIPIYGAYATIETDQSTGSFTGQVTGRVLERIENDIGKATPNLNEEVAFLIALSYVDPEFDHENHVRAKKVQLMIYANDTTAILVYDISFSLTINKTLIEPGFFVDANIGRILKFENRLTSAIYEYKSVGGNKKVKYTYNGEALPDLHVKKKGKRCALKSENVRVYNLQTKTDLVPKQRPFSYPCENAIKDEVNGAFSQLSDAFFFSEKTFQMYKEWANVQIVPKPPIDVWVHYGENKVQASYNGEDVVFGDGDRERFYPMVSADTMAHELSHAFTSRHSGMEYKGQSGAITESFSDMAGEALEFFIFKRTDFRSGANITMQNDRGVRDFCRQNVDEKSITNVKDYKDDINVHFTSGIFNKVACTMFKSKQIGVKATFQIFVHANRFYWHESTNFQNGGCGLLKATYDLGHDVSFVQTTLRGVGIQPCELTNYLRTLYGTTDIRGLSAVTGESIVFRIHFDHITEKIARIKTRDGSGDVDIYLGTSFPITTENAMKMTSSVGNKEKLKLRTAKCKNTDCYLMLQPKGDGFRDVTLKIDVADM